MNDKKVASLPDTMEIPISQIPPRERMGGILRRARQHAKMSIAEAVKAINDRFPTEGHYTDMVTELALSDIESGFRPIGQGQIAAASEVFGGHLYDPLLEAAQAWTREVWKEPEFLAFDTESVKTRKLPGKDDRDELLSLIKIGRSTMNATLVYMNQCIGRMLRGDLISNSADRESVIAMRDGINSLVHGWHSMTSRIDGTEVEE